MMPHVGEVHDLADMNAARIIRTLFWRLALLSPIFTGRFTGRLLGHL
jgi:hypothetical protein